MPVMCMLSWGLNKSFFGLGDVYVLLEVSLFNGD